MAALRTFSKTLGKSAAPKPARGGGGGARGAGRGSRPAGGTSKQPATPAAAAPGGGGGGGQPGTADSRQALPPRIQFLPPGGMHITGRKAGSKRKAPTPTASVTDLESLGRVLEQRQQRQAEAAAQALAGEAAAAVASQAAKVSRTGQVAALQSGEAGLARTPAPLPPVPLRGTPGAQPAGASSSGTSDSSAVSAWASLPGQQEQPSGGPPPKARRSRTPTGAGARGQGGLQPGVLLVPMLPPPRPLPLEAVRPVLLWPHQMLTVEQLLAPLCAQQQLAAAPAAGVALSLLTGMAPALPPPPASSAPAVLDVARVQQASAALQKLAGGGGSSSDGVGRG